MLKTKTLSVICQSMANRRRALTTARHTSRSGVTPSNEVMIRKSGTSASPTYYDSGEIDRKVIEERGR